MTVLVPLLIALCAAPLVGAAGTLRPRAAGPLSVALAAAACGATLWGWGAGGGSVTANWAPTWGLTLSFTLDGLAALYALLATAIGTLVLLYSSAYLPLHLEHQGRPPEDAPRFYALILLFMGAMVGLVMAQDLLLLFIFWDLTAIASYYLIGYDRQQAAARSAALMALLVTGVSAVLLLIGLLLLQSLYGTFALPEVIAQARPGAAHTVALALIAAGALAKSAQIPAHFWLPRAMAAPTPVSAYLHSAAMVAAGVFLLGRVYPLLRLSPGLLDAILVVGLLSMAVGSVLALTRDPLKQVLAYSTIAQYGYVATMLGFGSGAGVAGATFYVIAHALAKCALFLTAGAVTEATGEDRLSRLGGQWRTLPALAAASGAAAAGLAALPLTIGFFKDELFFKAALERGWPFAALAVLGAALTLAYTWHFWGGIFLGPVRGSARPAPPAMLAPIVALALLVVAGGLVVAPAADLAGAAAAVSFAGLKPIEAAYHLDARAENLLALATYGLGALIVATRPLWSRGAAALARLGERAGPERWYDAGLVGLDRLARGLLFLEVHDLRGRIATILVPTALLTGVGLIATPWEGAYRFGEIGLADLPLLILLPITALAALATMIRLRPLLLVLALSSVGYSLAGIYALLGAPDVALVAVLIETIMTLLFLGILALLPRSVRLGEAAGDAPRPSMRRRDALVGIAAGGGAFATVWAALSQLPASEGVAAEHLRLAPEAHARDVVTVILADFRGFDTLGEITVIGIALLGVATLLGLAGEWRRALGDGAGADKGAHRARDDAPGVAAPRAVAGAGAREDGGGS
jgi:multicomponent Na+:H+ antiporter subunit A